MKQQQIRDCITRLLLCVVIAGSGSLASRVGGQEPAAEGVDASSLYDADFDQHVDLRLFGVAFSTLDAKLMTDIALQLREAESVLGRKHKMITADQMLEFAAKMATEGKDAETVDRLIRVAKASDNEDRAEELEQMKTLAASSRDLREDAMFSAMDVNRGSLAAFANLTLQIRAAELSGDKETLESLRTALKKLESLREPHRNRLYGLIDDAENVVGDSEGDNTSDLLRSLTGASRDFYPGEPAPMAEPEMATAGGQQQPETAAMTIVGPPSRVQPGGSVATSFVAGGMRYMETPAGAIIQSYGRLGSLLFEPGDVITSIGGVPMGFGRSVDSGINTGYLTGNRLVVVRDRNSGRVLTLFY